MKNVSIDKFYKRINKRILLVSAYLENNSYNFIIKACRLKPFSLIKSSVTRDTKLEELWFDEFGNTLTVKKMGASIIINDLRIDNKCLIFAGLFDGVPLQDVVKLASKAIVLVGKEEDYGSDHIILTLYVGDSIRNFTYTDGSWTEISPLLIGLDALSYLSENLNIRYYKEITEIVKPILPCTEYKAWITAWPPKRLFISQIGNELIKKITKEIIVDE